MEFFTVEIPVKPYIRKYLVAKYGDPIQADMNTDFGFVILNTLASRLGKSRPNGNIIHTRKNHNTCDKVRVRLSKSYFYRMEKELHPEFQGLINRYFEDRFDEELFTTVNLFHQYIPVRRSCIELFAKFYHIEESDISIHGLAKKDDRYQKNKSGNFVSKLSFLKTAAIDYRLEMLKPA